MDTITLLMDRDEHLAHLKRVLAERFQVIVADAQQASPETVDLCVVDSGWLARRIDIEVQSRLAEAGLHENAQKYQALFEQSMDGIFLHDLDGTIIDANRAAVAQSGYTKQELLRSSVFDLHPDASERDAIVQQWRSWDCNQPVVIEAEHRCKDGSLLAVEITTGRVRIGERDLMLAIVRDISQRKRLEREQAKLRDQLQLAQKMESIGRLAGGVAHDLNNLLVPILGWAELLRQDVDAEPDKCASIDQILQAGIRARDLVRQLLAFGRKQTLSLEPVDLGWVAAGFEGLLRRTIREDIRIDIVAEPGLPPVMADAGQVEQVLLNLAVNAADAMPDGGRLLIETAAIELDSQQAAFKAVLQPGHYVMLAVSDTGCGLDAPTRERIFEPFFSTKGEQGTGLGLATVYGIVGQHGGDIWVYSEPDRGTTFKIVLPVAKGKHTRRSPDAAPATEKRGDETVLLVEDDDQVRRTTKSILERYGYTVIAARNGAEMLRTAASLAAPLHLLLTDVVLPGISGRELFERLSAQRPELRVLYMSGYTNNIIAYHGALEPGIHFIQKPFSVTALASKVREALDS